MLEFFDMYGTVFTFTTFKESKFKTKFGGILSILTICLLIAFSIIFGLDLILRLNPKITFQTSVTNNYPQLNVSNLNLMIPWRIEYSNATEANFTKYIFPVPVYMQWKRDSSGLLQNIVTKNLPVAKCKNGSIPGNTIPNLESYYCIAGDSINSSFGGFWDSDFVNYFVLGLYYCPRGDPYDPNGNCTNINDLANIFGSNNPWDISFFYPTYYLDVNSLSNPLKIFYKNYFYTFALGLRKTDTFYFQNTYIMDDQGWFIKGNETSNVLAVDTIKAEYGLIQNFSLIGGDSNLYSAIFYLNKNTNIYNRVFMKFQDLAAILGGILTIIMNACNIMSYFYNLYKRNQFLINEFFSFSTRNDDFVDFKVVTRKRKSQSQRNSRNSQIQNNKLILIKGNNMTPNQNNDILDQNLNYVESAKNLKSKQNYEDEENSFSSDSIEKKPKNENPHQISREDRLYERFFKEFQERNNRRQQYFFELFFFLKMICCTKRLGTMDQEKCRLYIISTNYLDERLDVSYYLKILQTIEKLKLVFMNKNQRLAFDFISKINLLNKNDRLNVENFLTPDIKKNAKDVINYYKGKELTRYKDVKIIKFLDPFLKAYLKDIN